MADVVEETGGRGSASRNLVVERRAEDYVDFEGKSYESE